MQNLSHHTGLGLSFLAQLACKSSPQSCDPLEWPKGLRFFLSLRKRACSAPQPPYQAAFLSLISIAFSVHDILFARFSVVNWTPRKNIWSSGKYANTTKSASSSVRHTGWKKCSVWIYVVIQACFIENIIKIIKNPVTQCASLMLNCFNHRLNAVKHIFYNC